ncbi:MAG: tetratricopeptide repeat protein [Acidobacteriota bacterium]|nr:tetratricopeptide repeat protein [Acidobacteriota bacterium]
MIRKYLLAILVLIIGFISVNAQTNQENWDRVIILPFENTSKAEFNWVGESIADSLTDLLKVPSLNVVSNQERQIIQQRLKIPLTVLPSLATSLRLAREGRASILVFGKYNVVPATDEIASSVNITSKIIRVNEGRFLSEDLPDGRQVIRDINLSDALGNLQTIQGQLAYQILYQRDKALAFSQNEMIETANKVPPKAFEAYIKGLLTPETKMQIRANFFINAMREYAEKRENGVYADAALELGHLFLNQKKYGDAIDFFSKIPQKNNQYAEAAFYTGLIHWQQKNYEQALAVLRPLAEDLKLTSVYNTIGAIAVQASLDEKKNDAKSAALLNEGIELLKKAAVSADEEMNPHFNYGFALYLQNDFKKAAEEFRPVLANSPRDGEAYFLLAKTLYKINDKETADQMDNQARRFLTLGNRYAKLESDWKNGKTNGIDLRVKQPTRREFISVILINNKVNTTVQTPVDEIKKLLAQAQEYYKKGEDNEAEKVLVRIRTSEPMNSETYLLSGKIFLRRGDLEQAISSFKTALFWNNQLVDAHVALGRIFMQKGDCLQAKNYSRSAMEIYKEDENAQAFERQVERCSK